MQSGIAVQVSCLLPSLVAYLHGWWGIAAAITVGIPLLLFGFHRILRYAVRLLWQMSADTRN